MFRKRASSSLCSRYITRPPSSKQKQFRSRKMKISTTFTTRSSKKPSQTCKTKEKCTSSQRVRWYRTLTTRPWVIRCPRLFTNRIASNTFSMTTGVHSRLYLPMTMWIQLTCSTLIIQATRVPTSRTTPTALTVSRNNSPCIFKTSSRSYWISRKPICLSTDRSTNSWWIRFWSRSKLLRRYKCIDMLAFHGEAQTNRKVHRLTNLHSSSN